MCLSGLVSEHMLLVDPIFRALVTWANSIYHRIYSRLEVLKVSPIIWVFQLPEGSYGVKCLIQEGVPPWVFGPNSRDPLHHWACPQTI